MAGGDVTSGNRSLHASRLVAPARQTATEDPGLAGVLWRPMGDPSFADQTSSTQTTTDLLAQTGQAVQSGRDATKNMSVPIPGEDPAIIPMEGAGASPAMGVLGGLGLLSGGLTVGKGI